MGKKYEAIYTTIRDRIMNGSYPSGSELPTELDLCRHYDVARITIQKAMKMLVDEGLVYRVAGKGTFVMEHVDIGDPMSLFFVVLPHHDFEFFRLIHGIETELSKEKCLYSLHFLENESIGNAMEERYVNMLLNLLKLNPRGFLCYPPSSSFGMKAYDEIIKIGVPIVLLDKEFDRYPIDCVVSDNTRDMYELTQHVIDFGHRDIAYISYDLSFGDSLEKRQNAYIECMRDNDLIVHDGYIQNKLFGHMYLPDCIEQLIQTHPELTAIVCANDDIAENCYTVLNRLGYRVPDDISVCSHDGYESSRKLRPTLTSAYQDLYEMGRAGAWMILKRLHSTDEFNHHCTWKYTLPTKLIYGDSVRNLNQSAASPA